MRVKLNVCAGVQWPLLEVEEIGSIEQVNHQQLDVRLKDGMSFYCTSIEYVPDGYSHQIQNKEK
jgi:hypothetical protein